MDALKSDYRQSGGFTLVENLMAMTIIVLVGIPLAAMLGMASNARTSADQHRESAHIARQIAAELAHSTAELGVEKARWYPMIAVQPVTGRADEWPYLTNLPADLSGKSVYVAYSEDFQPAGEITAAIYEKGLGGEAESSNDAQPPLFAIQIAFERIPANAGPPNTFRATVTVGSPAAAPVNARRFEKFSTLIHLADQTTGI